MLRVSWFCQRSDSEARHTHHCQKRHLLAVSRLETIGVNRWLRTHSVTHPLAENTECLRPCTSRSSRFMYGFIPEGNPRREFCHDMSRFSNAASSFALIGRFRGSR